MTDSPCEFCGMCVELCPTGALMAKKGIGAGPHLGHGQGQDHLPLLRRGLLAWSLNVKNNKIV